ILYGIVVFFLALHLAKYGFDKLFKHQFYFPEPNTLYTPLGYLDKDILYWSTIGSSYSYNVAMGIVELVPAFLLLFRRTRLLGGLIALGIMLHIVVLNFSFDISVKAHSTMLLLAAILIISPWFSALYNFFFLQKSQDMPAFYQTKISKLFTIIALLLVLLESLFPFVKSGNYNGDNIQKLALHGAYKVVEQRGDAPQIKRLFVHKNYYLIAQFPNDSMRDSHFTWGWNDTVPYFDLGKNGVLLQKWSPEDSTLSLEGVLWGDSVFVRCQVIPARP
ncbi:MAG: hypothetical protein AB8F95_17345, partial [Bacteroidia bacterium]